MFSFLWSSASSDETEVNKTDQTQKPETTETKEEISKDVSNKPTVETMGGDDFADYLINECGAIDPSFLNGKMKDALFHHFDKIEDYIYDNKFESPDHYDEDDGLFVLCHDVVWILMPLCKFVQQDSQRWTTYYSDWATGEGSSVNIIQIVRSYFKPLATYQKKEKSREAEEAKEAE